MTVKENFVLQSIEIGELKISGFIQDIYDDACYPILQTKWLTNELIPYCHKMFDTQFKIFVKKLIVENKPQQSTKIFNNIQLALFETESHPSTPDFETYRFYIIQR